MPEFRNPNLESQHPAGNGELRSFLVFAMLASVVLFCIQYVRQPKPSEPILSSLVHSQAVQSEIASGRSPLVQGQPIAAPSNFGWLAFIAKPLYLGLQFVHNHGIDNWGWSIIVLTVFFNLLIIWPRMASMRSSLKMMRVQPKVEALKKRYAHLKINDPKRAEMNEELMALYKAEGANMFGGCLPMLLQMPLLLAYVSVLRNATELHQAHWLWLTDLSSPDPLHILPLLIIGSMVLTQCITPAPGMIPSQRWMFAILMPAIMGLSLWHYASGLSLYWVTGNIINLSIQLVINGSKLGKEMRGLAAERTKAKN